MKLCALLLAAMLCTLCVGQASALEYTMNAPDDYLFGRGMASWPSTADDCTADGYKIQQSISIDICR